MMIKSAIFLVGALMLGLPTVSQAQDAPTYSRDDVVKSLLDQKTSFGKPRSICYGTDAECSNSKTAPEGFDMLLTFEFGSANLTPEAKRNLDIISDALQGKELATAKFLVEGHTDAKGSDDYNFKLSSERATAVADYLRRKHVSAERLLAQGLGKTEPREKDIYAAGNRRVELKLLKE